MILNWNAKAAKPFLQPNSWNDLPQGERYCHALSKAFAPWLPKILGYQILKLGALSGEITTHLPMRHQMIVNEKITPNLAALCSQNDSVIQTKLTELPFIQQEINAVFLANTLNFVQDPHQILREAHRVLTDDGWIFISIFNPLSPLIFKRKLGGYSLRHYPAWRIVDWLALLNFDVIEKRHLSIKHSHATIFSPLTVIIAQKRTYPLTLNPEKARSKIPMFLEPAGAFKLKADEGCGQIPMN